MRWVAHIARKKEKRREKYAEYFDHKTGMNEIIWETYVQMGGYCDVYNGTRH
jgi:hypothetical protein